MKSSNIAKQQQVYGELRQRIADGRLGPGYRLVIDAWARELGVSSIPVREAVRRLEAEGLVKHTPNVGFSVLVADDQALTHTLQALAVMEAWATAQAARVLTEDVLQSLRGQARRMSTAVEDGDLLAYGRMNRTFHMTLVNACENPYLIDLVVRAYDRLEAIDGAMFTRIPARSRQSLQEHYHIIQTIEEHAPEPVLEALVRRHKLATLRAVATPERVATLSAQR